MPQQSSELYFFLAIFLAVIVLAFFIFLPFLSILAIAAVFAVLFYPFFLRIKALLRCHEVIASLITVVIVVLALVLPLSYIGYRIFEEARGLVVALSASQGSLTSTLDTLTYWIAQYIPGYEINLREYAQQILGFFTGSLGPLFARTASVLFSVFLGLISFFYFLKDGDRFKEAVVLYSPLRDVYDYQIIEKLRLTISSVVKGSLFIALIQGVLSGIGLALFGVPNPVILGSLAALGALIPNIGTSLVLVPAVIYLFFTGSLAATIGLAIWAAFAVGLIDNFLGPYFIGRGVRIHPFFVLLSVLGGVSVFGPAGFILGPMTISLLVVLGEMYARLVASRHAA